MGRGAGRRGGRRVDGQPVVGSQPLDARDFAKQGGTAVARRWRGRRLHVAAGRAAHDDSIVGRRYAAVVAAARGRDHRGATRFDDDLATAAVVRRDADVTAAADAAVTTVFLIHHRGRVRVARGRYHAWTIAARHGVLLLVPPWVVVVLPLVLARLRGRRD